MQFQVYNHYYFCHHNHHDHLKVTLTEPYFYFRNTTSFIPHGELELLLLSLHFSDEKTEDLRE